MSNGTPLSRSANVCCVSSLRKYRKTLRQLLTFRFLPNLFESHPTFSVFPDEVLLLLDGARIAGDSKFDDDMGAVSNLPMRSERCGRLAARTMFKPGTDSMRWKNMACN